MENEDQNSMDPVRFAYSYFSMFSNAISTTPIHSIDRTLNSWQPPSSSFIKVNCEGATFLMDTTHGIEVIAHKANGECMSRCSRKKNGLFDLEHVEALTRYKAVRWHEDVDGIRIFGKCSLSSRFVLYPDCDDPEMQLPII